MAHRPAPTDLGAVEGADVDHVDAEQQVQRLGKDPAPMLPIPGHVQVQRGLHVGQALSLSGGRDAVEGQHLVGGASRGLGGVRSLDSGTGPAPPALASRPLSPAGPGLPGALPHLSRQRWSTSDGCHSAWGKARAKWAVCWPEPEATSSTRTPRWAGSMYCRSTRRIGSLFRSAAAATSIAAAQPARGSPYSVAARPAGSRSPSPRTLPGAVVRPPPRLQFPGGGAQRVKGPAAAGVAPGAAGKPRGLGSELGSLVYR